MATDGYDYTSESLEHVLQERNSMTRSERTYQKRIKQLEEELKGMLHQCQHLSDENKELRKSLDDIKWSKVSPQTDPVLQRGDEHDQVDLAARVAQLETAKENLQRMNEKLSTKARRNDNKLNQTDTMESTKLKRRNAELEREVQDLKEHVKLLSKNDKHSDTANSNDLEAFENKYGQIEHETAKVKYFESDNKSMNETLEAKREVVSELTRAMRNKNTDELNLTRSNVKLDMATDDMDSLNHEIEELSMLRQSERDKLDKLENDVAQRDTEIRKLKVDQEYKDKILVELRTTLEKSRQEVQMQQEMTNSYSDLEKNLALLKSRIGSLKADIGRSITENHGLKQEREEANCLIRKLQQGNNTSSDASVGSKRYFRKLETEMDDKNITERDVAKKDDELKASEVRLIESDDKINALYIKIKSLEDEKIKLKGYYVTETETKNRILKDENKRLRQILVERNIELTHKKSTQQYIDTRIHSLERKQKAAEVHVKQLSSALKPKIAKVSLRKHRTKSTTHMSMTPPSGWNETRKLIDGEGSDNSSSLPLILDSKSLTPLDLHGGYFRLYQNKLKNMKQRRF